MSGGLGVPAPAGVDSAPFDSPFSQTISSGLTLAPGQTRPLYCVNGLRDGLIGQFTASCTDSGLARTSYRLLQHGPDALVAVDGRGASRGGQLTTQTLPGGVKPSGLEHWIMSTGGKRESIRLDATLLAISAPAGHGFCHFSLVGKLMIRLH